MKRVNKCKVKYRKLFQTEPHAAHTVSLITHNGESLEKQPVTSGEALIRITEDRFTHYLVLTGEEMTSMAKQWLKLIEKNI
jgi:hypothetical protein